MKNQTQNEADQIIVAWLLSGRNKVLEVYSNALKRWREWVGGIPSDTDCVCNLFRLRPEPEPEPEPAPKKMVPWGPADVKPGMVFRTQHSNESYWCQPLNVGLLGVLFISQNISNSDNWCICWKTLQEAWLWSLDGVTWARCEKEVEG